MKKLFTLLAAAMMVVGAWAQVIQKDLIYKSNNEVVEASILEVSSSQVKYKEWNNQNGPTFILTSEEISKIQFSNGSEKIYSVPAAQPVAQPAPAQAAPAAPAAAAAPAAPAPQPAKPKMPIGFQMTLDLEGNLSFANGYAVTNGAERYDIKNYALGGLDAVISAGVRVGTFLYTGVAAGFLCEWADPYIVNKGSEKKGHFSAYTVPIYADIRAYAPTRGNCYPYAEIGIGGYLNDLCGSIKYEDISIKNPAKGGFYFISGVGVEFKYLNVGAGYKLMRNADYIGNHGYVKVGVSIGRPQKLRAPKPGV